MKIPMAERRVLTRHYAKEYQRSRKAKKGVILDGFVEATGYHRVYAARLLRNHGKRVWVKPGVAVQGDAAVRVRCKRPKAYGEEVLKPLVGLWRLLDYPCGKRLVAALPGAVEALERHGALRLSAEVREKLLRMSASTADRLLAPERRKNELRGRSGTKPSSLLKSQIPIRTFAEWNEGEPGFVEVDLVAHDGGCGSGDFAQTLDVTDVCTGWSEQRAVLNKAQKWVFEALVELRERFPFPLLGIDSDNGSEFINHHLLEYCEEKEITFTRARPYRKNDNCYIEQKNYSIVRRSVGYGRFAGEKAVRTLNELYDLVRLRTNFFLPSMKLIEKRREGSRVIKRYDKPKTPYQRVLEAPGISKKAKRELKRIYLTINPAAIDRKLKGLERRLANLLPRRTSENRQSPQARAGGVSGQLPPPQLTGHAPSAKTLTPHRKEVPFRKILDEATIHP